MYNNVKRKNNKKKKKKKVKQYVTENHTLQINKSAPSYTKSTN